MIYQIIMQDEWDNLTHLGFYNKLEDSISDINDFLSLYNVSIKKEDLHTRAHTFGEVFDTCVSDIVESSDDTLYSVYIRGFILSRESLMEVLNEKRK